MPKSESSAKGDSSMRLNKYLALQLSISRREADDLIAKKEVLVGGKTAELGGRINPGDVVTVSGKTVNSTPSKYMYVLLNKPVGYVCSRREQGSAPTIYSLLSGDLHHLKPVGRLDKNSSGLLLLTNDGDFAHQMTHPKFHKTKIYKVKLNQPLEPLHQQIISDFGVNLEDGRSQLTLERLDDSREQWQVMMSEGRNRQIRRTFAALGYDVVKLHRIQFGNYALGNIKRGQWREIAAK